MKTKAFALFAAAFFIFFIIGTQDVSAAWNCWWATCNNWNSRNPGCFNGDAWWCLKSGSEYWCFDDCQYGCSGGACNPPPNPCAGVTCNSPPASYCSGNNLIKYSSSGACSGGSCIYSYSSTACRSGIEYGSWSGNFCMNGNVYRSRTDTVYPGCSGGQCGSPSSSTDYQLVQNCGSYGCSNGACNSPPSCSAGWKCVSGTNRDYQYSNCGWAYGGGGIGCGGASVSCNSYCSGEQLCAYPSSTASCSNSCSGSGSCSSCNPSCGSPSCVNSAICGYGVCKEAAFSVSAVAPYSQSAYPGYWKTYSFTVKNNDNSYCSAKTYSIAASVPVGFGFDLSSPKMGAAPTIALNGGEQETVTLSVRASSDASGTYYPFVTVNDGKASERRTFVFIVTLPTWGVQSNTGQNCKTEGCLEPLLGSDGCYGVGSKYCANGCDSATGICIPCPAGSGQTKCGSSCVNLQSDANNCGSCSNACSASATSYSGNYCAGGNVVKDKTTYSAYCSGGACQNSPSTAQEPVQTCAAAAPSYSNNYCSGGNIVRDKTTYAPYCSGASCQNSPSTSQEPVQTCQSGYTCNPSTVSCVDNVPPSVSVSGSPKAPCTLDPTAGWIDCSATISVSCSDAGSGCKSGSYGYKIYDSNPGACPASKSSYMAGGSSALLDERKWACAYAEDNVGNGAASSPTEIKINKTFTVTVDAKTYGQLEVPAGTEVKAYLCLPSQYFCNHDAEYLASGSGIVGADKKFRITLSKELERGQAYKVGIVTEKGYAESEFTA